MMSFKAFGEKFAYGAIPSTSKIGARPKPRPQPPATIKARRNNAIAPTPKPVVKPPVTTQPALSGRSTLKMAIHSPVVQAAPKAAPGNSSIKQRIHPFLSPPVANLGSVDWGARGGLRSAPPAVQAQQPGTTPQPLRGAALSSPPVANLGSVDWGARGARPKPRPQPPATIKARRNNAIAPTPKPVVKPPVTAQPSLSGRSTLKMAIHSPVVQAAPKAAPKVAPRFTSRARKGKKIMPLPNATMTKKAFGEKMAAFGGDVSSAPDAGGDVSSAPDAGGFGLSPQWASLLGLVGVAAPTVAGAILGAGAGGATGLVRAKPITGVGRGIVRGGMTGAGATLGGAAGHRIGGPVGGGVGAVLGAGAGYMGGGAVLGPATSRKEDHQNAQLQRLEQLIKAHQGGQPQRPTAGEEDAGFGDMAFA